MSESTAWPTPGNAPHLEALSAFDSEPPGQVSVTSPQVSQNPPSCIIAPSAATDCDPLPSHTCTQPNLTPSADSYCAHDRKQLLHHVDLLLGFSDGPRAAPWTPSTRTQYLEELDVKHVLTNAQLRHDVALNPALRLRPVRTERRAWQEHQFWASVAHELSSGCRCSLFPDETAQESCKDFKCLCSFPVAGEADLPLGYYLPSRVYNVFAEMARLLDCVMKADNEYIPCEYESLFETLLDKIGSDHTAPIRTHNVLRSVTLDILQPQKMYSRFVMASTRDAQAIASYGQFIGTCFLTYCAPLRDSAVHKMMNTLIAASHALESSGSFANVPSALPSDQSAVSLIVSGLSQVLELEELMIFDMANHRLRMLKGTIMRNAALLEQQQLHESFRMVPYSEMSTGSKVPFQSKLWIHMHKWLLTSVHSAFETTCELFPNNTVNSLDWFENDHVPHLSGLLCTVSQGLLDMTMSYGSCDHSECAHATLCLKQGSDIASCAPMHWRLDRHRILALKGKLSDIVILHMLLILLQTTRASLKRPALSKSALTLVKTRLQALLAKTNESLYDTASRDLSATSSFSSILTCPLWADGMDHVILELASLVFWDETHDFHHESCSVPEPKTMAMLHGYFTKNMNADAQVLKLFQRKLRNTLLAHIMLEFQAHMPPAPVSKKRKFHESPIADVNVNAAAHNCLNRYGLGVFAEDIQQIASQMAVVVAFHTQVHRHVYMRQITL